MLPGQQGRQIVAPGDQMLALSFKAGDALLSGFVGGALCFTLDLQSMQGLARLGVGAARRVQGAPQGIALPQQLGASRLQRAALTLGLVQ